MDHTAILHLLVHFFFSTPETTADPRGILFLLQDFGLVRASERARKQTSIIMYASVEQTNEGLAIYSIYSPSHSAFMPGKLSLQYTTVCALMRVLSPLVFYQTPPNPPPPARGPAMRDVSVTLDTCRAEMVASKLSGLFAFTMW